MGFSRGNHLPEKPQQFLLHQLPDVRPPRGYCEALTLVVGRQDADPLGPPKSRDITVGYLWGYVNFREGRCEFFQQMGDGTNAHTNVSQFTPFFVCQPPVYQFLVIDRSL